MYCIHVLHPCTAYVYMGRGFCASLVALCGVCCTAGLCGAPVASCLHGVPRANWNVVCRLTRGMSQGECHVACCMAYYMATATWHDVWRMLYGSTEFMQCCSALLARPRRAVPAADRLLARATISDRSGPGRLRTASRQAAVCVCFCRHRACVNPDACLLAAALLPLGMHL